MGRIAVWLLLLTAACGRGSPLSPAEAGDLATEPDDDDDGGAPTPDGAGPDSGGAPDDPDAIGGTRLRPVFLVSAEGAREQFLSFYDSLRQEDCDFNTAEDGVERCLPTSAGAYAGIFLDAQCSQRIAGSFGPARYGLVDVDHTGCATRARVYQLGAPLSLGDHFQGYFVGYPADQPTHCGPGPFSDNWDTFYTVGALVDAVDFVGATRAHDQATTRLQSYERMGDDGSRQWLGYYDAPMGTVCGEMLAADQVHRCLPSSNVGVLGNFLDAACTTLVAEGSDCNAAFSPYALGKTTPDQTWSQVFPVLGPLVHDPSVIYAPSNTAQGVCQQYAHGMGTSVVPVGPETPPSAFVALPVAEAPLEVRVRPRVYDPVGFGRRSTPLAWHDTKLDVDCLFALAVDGSIRCLPVEDEVITLYSDPACTAPLGTSPNGFVVDVRVNEIYGPLLSTVHHVYRTGPYIWPMPAIYWHKYNPVDGSVACAPYDGRTQVYVRPLTEVAPDLFAEARPMIE
jgi:hypothetical protein